MNLDNRIAEIRSNPQGVRERAEVSRFETTLLKYENGQIRLSELERKIQRLTEEKDNLVRKQENRRKYLEKQSVK
jgi:hypothetical protein